ncbi:uncharacterized protein M6B38_140105 [Iris pallida]|uniref:PWWP domain-containing protein n=1 Tax=Iris pallida TaxID=29817 RepID=A0AAX6FCL3_IRIPA|nr:uncharacterized protein M6B38_140105 [Iris pallida]
METLETPKTLAEGQPENLAMPAAESTELALVSPPSGGRTPFSAGDLVWGRIKGHSWWPGRVCDQSGASDRSNPTAKPYRSVPVSYFGEDVISWCKPSQLKPFVENFHQLAGSSRSKGFVAALESTLDEIGKCLEVQLVCFCVPEEERNQLEKYFLMNPGVGNYSAVEFLHLVRKVAVDLSAVDLLEITRLRGWVVAYERGCSYADPSVCHQRKGIKDLVDKIDLDVPPSDLVEEKEEEEAETLRMPNERSRRGKRSMTVLIAETDLGMVDVSDGNEEKNNGSSKSENGNMKDEDTGPGRRERKKSKYLSPPYTDLAGGYSKLMEASANISETKRQKSSRALVTRSSSDINKYEAELLEEEEEKSSPSLKFDSVTTAELLAELLALAVNPLHLKRNSLARTVTGFFLKYRSSTFSSGAEFISYQKHVTESVGANMEIMNKEVVNVEVVNKEVMNVENLNQELGVMSEGGKKSEGKRGRRKEKANGESKTLGELGHQASEQSVTKHKAARKRKMAKEGADSETPASLKVMPVTLSGEGNSGNKKGKRKTEGNDEVKIDLECKPLNIVESDKKEQNPNNDKVMAEGKPLEVACGDSNSINEASLVQKKKKKKKKKNEDEARIGLPIGLVNNPTNGSEASWKVDSAALHLSFSQGISLPSRENLISEFSKYGPLIESHIELLNETSSARVVFLRSTDAEKAFNDKVGPFGPPVATYRLHYLTGNLNYPPVVMPVPPVPRPPLPYIRKNLERMISSLHGGSPAENASGTSEGLKPEAAANLVGAMQGLLTKVNQMLGGPAAGTST